VFFFVYIYIYMYIIILYIRVCKPNLLKIIVLKHSSLNTLSNMIFSPSHPVFFFGLTLGGRILTIMIFFTYRTQELTQSCNKILCDKSQYDSTQHPYVYITYFTTIFDIHVIQLTTNKNAIWICVSSNISWIYSTYLSSWFIFHMNITYLSSSIIMDIYIYIYTLLYIVWDISYHPSLVHLTYAVAGALR